MTAAASETVKQASILIVDDKPANLISLETILKGAGVTIIQALSGEQALAVLLEHEIALILLDVQMPGMDGFETAELIRGNSDTQSIPIIFVTAMSAEKKNIFRGYESGAVDLLFKPIDANILQSKVAVFLDLYHQRKIIEAQNTRLDLANIKIMEQHRALIEEERLKVVLQMAGATAHELNQPLMLLLGNMELLELDNFEPESVKKLAPKIITAAQRLSDTVKRIQTLEGYKTKKHDGKTHILNIDNEVRVLYVEDNNTNYKVTERLLRKNTSMKVFRAETIASALDQLEKETFDVILLDYSLPDGTGLDLLKEMNRRKDITPVICITGQGSEMIASELLRGGAYDYLPKQGINKELLIGTIKSALEKFRLKSDLHLAMEKMADMSTHDALTGLYNRRYMNEVMDQEFSRAMRYGLSLSCILLDLDFFKQVNDNFGHNCGDFVLTEFASRIMLNKRESDYAFRYGGEEFLLLLPQTDARGAGKTAENLLTYCRNHKYVYDKHSFIVTVSMGIADVSDCKPNSGNQMIAFADKALYRAKADGRNCVRVFNKGEEEGFPFERIYDGKGFVYLKEQLASLLSKTKKATITSLELLIQETGGAQLEEETQRIKTYVSLFCKKLGLPEPIARAIKQAASLNNCFKIVLGDEVLLKKEALTDKDKKKIERLPYLQMELISQFEAFAEEKKVLLHNHEWYDGSGYPEGRSFDEIPLGAKIFSIISALVAMTSDRAFRKKLTYEQAVDEIVKNAGTQFDPMLVNSFLDTIIENNLMNISEQARKNMKTKLDQAR